MTDASTDQFASLRDAIAELIDQPGDRAKAQAGDIINLLMERGHYLPGAPPADQILKDAESFAGRLILSNLTVRLIAMLYTLKIETPETKPAKRWLDDYLEGKNHGPVGSPMLWPGRMPGLCAMLRDWGFQPTPTMPPFVARAVPAPVAVATVQ